MLVVHPGCIFSVGDVFRGVHDALQRQGVEVIEYNLEGRISTAQRYLDYVSRRCLRPGQPKPTAVDTVYLACQDILIRGLRYQVDWVLILTGTSMHPDSMILMRRAGLRLATILTESPYTDSLETMIARCSNVCWTNERTSVATFSPWCPTYYWQHAMDPAKHMGEPTEEDAKVLAHDVVFVGTGFRERIDLLKGVNWDGIDLGLYGTWELLGSRSHLRKYVRGGLTDNKTTAALYRRAKIGLNLHRTSMGYGNKTMHITHAESMNPRCYELAACGLFFLTDRRAEVDEVFGGIMPTFETPAQLERLVRQYLTNDEARQRIAAELPRLVAGHTFDARVTQLIKTLSEYKGA
jgi:spore maturation protein CgeB